MLSTIMQLGKPCMYTVNGSFTVPTNSQWIWVPMGDDLKCSIHAARTQIRNLLHIHELVEVMAMTYPLRMEIIGLKCTPNKTSIDARQVYMEIK